MYGGEFSRRSFTDSRGHGVKDGFLFKTFSLFQDPNTRAALNFLLATFHSGVMWALVILSYMTFLSVSRVSSAPASKRTWVAFIIFLLLVSVVSAAIENVVLCPM